jgi:hypothetical protein
MHSEGMARVIVIGAGLAGLATAMEASVRGHHVVVLEQRSTIGGRASSELRDDFPIGFGPHFLLKKGPLHRLVLKISRMKPSTLPLRPHRIELVGQGMMQPRSPMIDAVLYRRAVRKYELAHPSIRAAEHFASWGMASEVRSKAFLRSKLLGLNEGWSGLIGRLAVTLDEVGVPIETGAKVTQIERNKVHLADGRHIETDVIILACGYRRSKQLLPDLPECEMLKASTIDVALDSTPLGDKHAILDVKNSIGLFDLKQIHPGTSPSGSLLSAICFSDKSKEQRIEMLDKFLDQRAPGWRSHILHDRRQEQVTVAIIGKRPSHDSIMKKGILLTGAWVESEHILSDGAVASARLAAESIASIPLQK